MAKRVNLENLDKVSGGVDNTYLEPEKIEVNKDIVQHIKDTKIDIEKHKVDKTPCVPNWR